MDCELSIGTYCLVRLDDCNQEDKTFCEAHLKYLRKHGKLIPREDTSELVLGLGALDLERASEFNRDFRVEGVE